MTMTLDRLVDPYDQRANATNFDFDGYLAGRIIDDALLDHPAGRRELTRLDPLLFAVIYVPHLIKGDVSMPLDQQGAITFADLHLELCRYALTHWIVRAGPKEDRDVFIAPRNSGKSTWLFLILPLWALAHQHLNFIAAFSSAGPQATKHLAAFKNELDTNDLLRTDFPRLCRARKRPGGQSVADTQKMYYSTSEQTFTAAGLDEDILGLTDPRKRRPELIILDDVEPAEDNYSLHLVGKRMLSIRDTVLPMNENAHVTWVGTVTMLGSLVHQLVQTTVAKESPAEWIVDERFKVHYFDPIPDGTRSIWPAKWPLTYLLSIQHQRGYKKNFLNQPVPEGSPYWQEETFRYGAFNCVRTLIQIDPATTKTATSDYYGIAVIGYKPAVKERIEGTDKWRIVEPAKCMVRYARAFRISPGELRKKIVELITIFGEVGRVRIEVNQGGDTWKEILKDLPVRLIVHTESVKKEVRAQNLLHAYEQGLVWHEIVLTEAEMQMMAFPNVIHDDLVDAIGAGVQYLLKGNKRKARSESTSYL